MSRRPQTPEPALALSVPPEGLRSGDVILRFPSLDDVDVIHGDTKIVAKGMGTFGSRATAVGGVAVYQAAEKVREKARYFECSLIFCRLIC